MPGGEVVSCDSTKFFGSRFQQSSLRPSSPGTVRFWTMIGSTCKGHSDRECGKSEVAKLRADSTATK